MVISVIIVEDNLDAAQLLKLQLRKYKQINILGHYTDKKSATEAINLHNPDLLFMDINIKGGSGLDVLNACKDKYSFVVFITGYDEFLHKSFDYNTIHYLIKPFKEKALDEAIEKVRKYLLPQFKLQSLNQNFLNNSSNMDEKIFLSAQSSMQAVSANSILYLESDRSYCDVYTVSDVFKTSKNLTQMHKQLEKFPFFIRVHRSYLVNINHIIKVKRGASSILQLSNGTIIPVSNNEKANVFKILGITD